MLVPASLAEGAKHGYAITMDIAEQVEVWIGPGTAMAVALAVAGVCTTQGLWALTHGGSARAR